MVDMEALDLAETSWRRRPSARALNKRPENPASLFDTVVRNPQKFRGIGFAFTTGSASIEDRDKAAALEIAKDKQRESPVLKKAEEKALRQWKVYDTFNGSEQEDVSAWPKRFVCAHRPRKKLTYWFYERMYAFVDQGVVFATRPPRLFQKMGFTYNGEEMAEVDAERAANIFYHIGDNEHFLFESGEKLAQFLDEIATIKQTPT